MKITDLKSAVINESFFKVMEDFNLSLEALLVQCANHSIVPHLNFSPELEPYSRYSTELVSLLLNNLHKINFSQLKRVNYKFLKPFFIKNQQMSLTNTNFCLKFIECIQLTRGHFDVLFEVYPFLTKQSIHEVPSNHQNFYHNFWITVFKNQNLSVFEINRFYGHCLKNQQYATLLTSSQNQFWQCNPKLTGSVIKIRDGQH